MDSLTPVVNLQKSACSPFHCLHVYRHVDSEKVESNPFAWSMTSKSRSSSRMSCFPSSTVLHGEQTKSGEHLVLGGAR